MLSLLFHVGGAIPWACPSMPTQDVLVLTMRGNMICADTHIELSHNPVAVMSWCCKRVDADCTSTFQDEPALWEGVNPILSPSLHCRCPQVFEGSLSMRESARKKALVKSEYSVGSHTCWRNISCGWAGIPGWGNNERQQYMTSNVAVQGGNLVITAKRESGLYSSGKIKTQGLRAFKPSDGQNGIRVEARMQLPTGTESEPLRSRSSLNTTGLVICSKHVTETVVRQQSLPRQRYDSFLFDC